MSGLTPEDIKTLQAPLPLSDHEAREKGTNKDKTKKQYLFYINQEGVIPLLNAIDPNWSWDVLNVHFEQHYVSVTGRLTIKGVARDGVGGNSPNGASAPVDEDTVKGAETDALKRAALRFGVGLYLRSSPMCWVDANLPPWEGAKVALAEFGAWYKREYGAQNGNKPQPRQQPTQNAPTPAGGAQTGVPATSRPNDLSGSTPNGNPNAGVSAELFPHVIEGAVTIELPIIGSIDMKALGKRAFDEKLVHGQRHFADLIKKMRSEGWIRDAMNADQVIEAIRKREADKDLAKEGAP